MFNKKKKKKKNEFSEIVVSISPIWREKLVFESSSTFEKSRSLFLTRSSFSIDLK